MCHNVNIKKQVYIFYYFIKDISLITQKDKKINFFFLIYLMQMMELFKLKFLYIKPLLIVLFHTCLSLKKNLLKHGIRSFAQHTGPGRVPSTPRPLGGPHSNPTVVKCQTLCRQTEDRLQHTLLCETQKIKCVT